MKRILLREHLIWQALRADNSSEFDVLWKILQSPQVQGYITAEDLEVLSRRIADEQEEDVAMDLIACFCRVLEIYPENEDLLLDATLSDNNLTGLPTDQDDIPLLSVKEFLQRYAIYELYTANRQSFQLKEWYRKWVSSEFDPLFIIPLVLGLIMQHLPAVKDILANLLDGSDPDSDPFKLVGGDTSAKIEQLSSSGDLDTEKQRSQTQENPSTSEPENVSEEELFSITVPEHFPRVPGSNLFNQQEGINNLDHSETSSLSNLLIFYRDEIIIISSVEDQGQTTEEETLSPLHNFAQNERDDSPDTGDDRFNDSRFSADVKNLRAPELASVLSTAKNKQTNSPSQASAHSPDTNETKSTSSQNPKRVGFRLSQGNNNIPEEGTTLLTLTSMDTKQTSGKVKTTDSVANVTQTHQVSTASSQLSNQQLVNPQSQSQSQGIANLNIAQLQSQQKLTTINTNSDKSLSLLPASIVNNPNRSSHHDPLTGFAGVNVNTNTTLTFESNLMSVDLPVSVSEIDWLNLHRDLNNIEQSNWIEPLETILMESLGSNLSEGESLQYSLIIDLGQVTTSEELSIFFFFDRANQ